METKHKVSSNMSKFLRSPKYSFLYKFFFLYCLNALYEGKKLKEETLKWDQIKRNGEES